MSRSADAAAPDAAALAAAEAEIQLPSVDAAAAPAAAEAEIQLL
jgi:hypothetical protein